MVHPPSPWYPPTWYRELGRGGYPPVARPWLPCLSPTPAQRAGPQSQQGLCCRADGEVSVPSGKTERVFLAVTQALEEAAALLPPASASEEEGMGVSASVVFSQGLYPALAQGSSSALPGVTSAACIELPPDPRETPLLPHPLCSLTPNLISVSCSPHPCPRETWPDRESPGS